MTTDTAYAFALHFFVLLVSSQRFAITQRTATHFALICVDAVYGSLTDNSEQFGSNDSPTLCHRQGLVYCTLMHNFSTSSGLFALWFMHLS